MTKTDWTVPEDRECPRCGGPGYPYCGYCERDGNLDD